jgi:hypothetical protein
MQTIWLGGVRMSSQHGRFVPDVCHRRRTADDVIGSRTSRVVLCDNFQSALESSVLLAAEVNEIGYSEDSVESDR